MGDVICFQCGQSLPTVGKPMKELIEDRLPLFCCNLCASRFPDNGSMEFEYKMEELYGKYGCSSSDDGNQL